MAVFIGIIVILFGILFFIILLNYKNNRTAEVMTNIVEAIGKYRKDCILNNTKTEVDFSDMKSYNAVFWNLFNWSYESVLEHNKYIIIKKYINK